MGFAELSRDAVLRFVEEHARVKKAMQMTRIFILGILAKVIFWGENEGGIQ